MVLEEAAEYLGLTARQLARLVQSRRIPFYRPSGSPYGRLQFRREDLDAYMTACRVEANA